MAIRRSRTLSARKRESRGKLSSELQRQIRRSMQVERLEERQLLAGAQLIGIQPNNGELLRDGDIRNIAPADLTFRFDQSQQIDPASLGDPATVGGIQITRSNRDGVFEHASVKSDFGTAGKVWIRFSAVRLGQEQNGIKLAFTKSDFGGPGLPGVSVVGRTINVNLNINAANPTTAQDLVNALGKNVDASNLIQAEILDTSTALQPESVNIAATATANSSLTLGDPNNPNAVVANDEVIYPGYIGVAAQPALNEVLFRFAGNLPDDKYRIDIFGTGAKPLKNVNNEVFRDGQNQTVGFELDLAPQIVSVVPQPIVPLTGGALQQQRSKIEVYFNNDDLNVTAAQTKEFYQLIFTSGTVENQDDVVFNPLSVVYSADKDMAVLDFGVPLEQLVNPLTGLQVGTGTFRLRIGTLEINKTQVGVAATPAPPVLITPTTEATAAYNGVGVRFLGLDERWGKAIRVEVIASDHGADSLPKVTVWDNVITVDLNTNAAATNVNSPSTAQQMVDAINAHYNASQLVRASVVAGSGDTAIAGPAYPVVTLKGMGSSFDTATNLGDFSTLGNLQQNNFVIRGVVDPQVYTLTLPGGNDDPGNRKYLVQHLADDSANTGGDGLVDMGIQRFEYNFRQDIGFVVDPYGNNQATFNLITEAQKRRAREALQLLNDQIGVEFVETERDGIIIASGDLSSFNPNQPLLVLPVNLDDRFNWRDETTLTNGWFRAFLNSITGQLGLGATPELPGRAIRGEDIQLSFPDNRIEPTIFSDHDLVHLQYLYYAESKDIDMVRFELQTTGHFTAETLAERQLQSSLLDTTLTLYREQPDGSRVLLARNDNYFSRDSYIELDLQPGVYYVGVSASGNDEYDPTIEDSGFGGTTQGEYELRLNFRPDVTKAIFDADNPNSPPTFIDGDGDGVPGGVYQFWFNVAPPLTSADVAAGSARVGARTFFVNKAAPNGGTGTETAPFNNIGTAFKTGTAVRPGDIVRIVGNPGADGKWETLTDNLSYQIGFNSLGQALPDGSTLEIPKGVTVMVDANAIFQMRRSRIGVGSSAAGIDRSGGALQVLGTPIVLDSGGNVIRTDTNGDGRVDSRDSALRGSVYFTSYNDTKIGLDTNPLNTPPAAGDWGGIVFRDDVDRADGNFVYDEEGIFLNYVNHADIAYGGGNVLINSVATVVNPIHVTNTRPTVTYNTIRLSADAAMSANPDAFEETNFHAPRHQRIPFTSDYDRIGPEIHHNQLVNNSVNGLFVRVATEAGSSALKLNVSGRWDDRDIVHVLSENLAIASQPGGRNEKVTAPPINLITQTKVQNSSTVNGTLGRPAQDTRYEYKLVPVDLFGNEGPASRSLPTATLTAADVGAGRRSIRLAQLPPAGTGYVARRLYRSENDGAFVLVAQLNGRDTTYTDTGKIRGGVLQVPPVRGLTLAPLLGGNLAAGTYNYRVTYVDATGKEWLPSDPTANVTVNGNPDANGLPGQGTIELNGLPLPDATGNFTAKRIYRSTDTGISPYTLVAELDASITRYADNGLPGPGADPNLPVILNEDRIMPRPDGRLMIEPAITVKLDGVRIELELGAQLIAEGHDGQEIIFTSIADDRYGAGGTFDTGNDGAIQAGTSNAPAAGNWGGIYAGPLSRLNIDHAVLAYGGGVTRVEGTFTAFNTLEIHEQSEARVANSVFEFNARGQGGQGETNRFGRGFNEPAVIFVRQAQPVIYNNVFRNNPDANPDNTPADPNQAIPAISINVNALNYVLKRDTGRTSGGIDRVEGYRDNHGPLILDNQLDNNELNGMVVRGQTLTTQSIWDDTDIVHVVLDTIYVSDFHTFGGLVLTSSPTESLVVKLFNDPNDPNHRAGFVATGIPHEIEDRIGGIIQIVGHAGSPVVLTSLADDTHGAGTRPDGNPQTDTNSDGNRTSPRSGDWNSIRLDRFSHDRNVALLFESEPRDVNSPGTNAAPDDAQLLGILAPSEYAGDENRRLGFTVHGFLNDPADLDVYSFKGIPGTEVWIDMDRTTHAFDPVIEVLDSDGNLVARSDNSADEVRNPNNHLEPSQRDADHGLTARQLADPTLLASPQARLMDKTPQIPTPDFYTTNPRDPGLRLLLPGIPDPTNPQRPLTYHVRVRSSSPNLDNLGGGVTSGAYQLQIRLRELQEIGGSTVRYARIGYATNGIEIYGQPIHSPLVGEAGEDTSTNNASPNAQRVGNLVNADRNAISVAGVMNSLENNLNPDVDFYEFDIAFLDPDVIPQYPILTYPVVFDIDYADGIDTRPNTMLNVYRLFDMNGTPEDRTDDVYRLVYTARDANVAEDRPATPGSSDVDDMSRGSLGASDPFLGVVDLAIVQPPFEPFKPYPHATFRVAVSPDGYIPTEMNQFTAANAVNSLLRLEPIPNVRRVAEDHIDFGNITTADPPQVSALFDQIRFATEGAAVPWKLGDVTMYLSRDLGVPGDATSTTVLTANPFTGTLTGMVGNDGINGSFGFETGDIAMHEEGWLYAYRLARNEVCGPNDNWSGNYLSINPGNGAASIAADDNIQTYIVNPANAAASVRQVAPCPAYVGEGIEFNALTFVNNQDGFAVGERGYLGNASPGVEIIENILYRFVAQPQAANQGLGSSAPYADETDNATIPETIYDGAGTQIRERGELLTSPRLEVVYGTGSPLQAPTGRPAIQNILDGQTFTVVDGSNRTVFEFDLGAEVRQNISPQSNISIRDGMFFQLDDNIFQINTGAVIELTAGGTTLGGAVVTINDGITSEAFEFVVDPQAPRSDPTATAINIGVGTSALQAAGLLAAAINASPLTGIAHAPGSRVSIEGDFTAQVSAGSRGIFVRGDGNDAPILQMVAGSQINDADTFFIRSRGAPTPQPFEFNSGYTLVTPVRYMLQAPGSGGRSITDGEYFTVTNSVTGANVRFEFDLGGTTTVVSPNLVLIGYNLSDSADVIGAAIFATLNSATLGGVANPAVNLMLQPTDQGGGLVHLGSTADNTLSAVTAPNLTASGGRQGLIDGDFFRISNGLGRTVFFEFDDNGTLNDVTRLRIPFSQIETHDDIANSIVAVVGGAGLALNPVNMGNGRVYLGGDNGLPVGSPNHTLDTSGAGSRLVPVGDPRLNNANAVEVPYTPIDTAATIANKLSAAILQASAAPIVIQALPGNQYFDGLTFQVDDRGTLYTFEYDNTRFGPAGVAPGRIRIPFDPGDPSTNPATPGTTAAQMAFRIWQTVDAVTQYVTVTQGVQNRVVIENYPVSLTTLVANDRVVVNGDRVIFLAGTSPVRDLTTIGFGFTPIDSVEESYDIYNPDPRLTPFLPPDYQVVPSAPAPFGRNMTDHIIATRVAAVVGSHLDYQLPNGLYGAGGFLNRINVPNAVVADFSGMVTETGVRVWTQVPTSSSGVAAGSVRIPVLADDWPVTHGVDRNVDGVRDGTATGLAPRITTTINNTLNAIGITATNLNQSRFIRLNRGSVVNNSSLITAGEGPGGTVTGIASLPNGQMYVVSDRGGLYRVNNPYSDNATTTYIRNSEHDLLGIQFTGLTAGPPNVEEGRYANMLFATDAAGRIYAFDTTGELQPIFVNGATSLSTGNHPTEVRGIAFSTLDYNLFHVTTNQPYPSVANAMDVRVGAAGALGQAVTVDGRQFTPGHVGSPNGTGSIHFGQGNINGVPRSYEFPGGAHGTIVSDEFSLKGYAAADRPVLYFSYFLDTENANTATAIMRDSFRVYIADNDGDWQLVTTNNNHPTELGLGPFTVQQAFDRLAIGAAQWRQVRVPLDTYAGRENLRLRIDFDTAADRDTGNPATTGEEIRTVAGQYIQDGQTLVLNSGTFEFDSGLTVVAPTGSAVTPGEQLTIYDDRGRSAILQFVNNVLTVADIVATDGSQLFDGDTFWINDGAQTVSFEFDSGYILQVPATGGGGVNDREVFVVDADGPAAGSLPPRAFEFDKDGVLIDVDGVPGPDNVSINIRDNLTILVPFNGGGSLGDQDRFTLRRGATTFTFEFDKNNNLITPSNQRVNIADNLRILLPASGGGFLGVRDGDTFTIDNDPADLIPAVRFEFFEENSTRPPTGDVQIRFNYFTTQDVLADSVVNAVNGVASLGLTAKNTGGGRVVLDGTTPLHRLNVAGSPTVAQDVVALTQDEVVARITAALDRADGVDGTVLGLTVPDPATVIGGAIVLGGTTAQHQLDVRGAAGLNQTDTPRPAQEVADRIANAINSYFAALTDLRAASLQGGMVTVLDLSGDTAHTVDVTAAPGLTLTGTPGVATGAVRIPFLPTDTLDQIINGAPPVVAGAETRPGMVVTIDNSDPLNPNPYHTLQVAATQSAFPNEDVIVLTGTAGNPVTFSPGVTALRPQGVIPIYVDGTQTANEVAERIATAVNQARLRQDLVGVFPHLDADLGYDSPSIAPGDFRLNLVNLEGAQQVVLSLGAASAFRVTGVVGLNNPQTAPNNILVPFHSDMTRQEIADQLDRVLENAFHNDTIITRDGSFFVDGDTFILDDGINPPVTYEFESGFLLNVPPGGGNVAQGGIRDGEWFQVRDITGTIVATFELDKNGSVISGNTAVTIRETDGQIAVARQIVQAVQGHPLRAVLGLNPRVVNGDQVQLGGASGTTLTLSPGGTLSRTLAQPGVSPSVTITVPQTLAMQLPDPLTIHVPNGGILDGETFVIGDGQIAPVIFEFEDTGIGDGVTGLNVPVIFNRFSSADEIGRRIVEAIAGSGLNVAGTMLGGTGNIDLGGGAQFVLTLPALSPLLRTGLLAMQVPAGGGSVVLDGDQFTITNGLNTFTFEFENRLINNGVAGTNIAISYFPTDTQDVLADRIVQQLRLTPGLNLNPSKSTPGSAVSVHLGSVAYDTSPLTNVTLTTVNSHLTQTGQHDRLVDGQIFVIGDGTQVVRFELDLNGATVPGNAAVNVSAGSTPHQIASEIIARINGAGLGLLPAYLGNGRIHVGGTLDHALDTTQVPNITRIGSGGPIADGTTFLITEGANTARFEFDTDGVFVSTTNVRVRILDTDSTDVVVQKLIGAMGSASSGLNIFPRNLGNGVIDLGGNQTHVVTLTSGLTLPGGLQVAVPAAGGALTGVVDGEELFLTDTTDPLNPRQYIFEFDNNGLVDTSGDGAQTFRIAVPFTTASTQNDVALALVNAARNEPSLNLDPIYLGNGLVDLRGDTTVYALSLLTTPLSTSGLAGAQVPHVAVPFTPASDFTAHDVAVAIGAAINRTLAFDLRATVGNAATADQRRVELRHLTAFTTPITFTPDADGDLKLETPADVVKQDNDLIRIIGHSVVNPGPLGHENTDYAHLFLPLETRNLPGEQFGLFSNLGTFYQNTKALNNRFEGLYLDDFIIGFAERGEAVSGAVTSSTPAFGGLPTGRTEGPYQLEIRGGPGLQTPLINPQIPARSMDTNDRMAVGQTMVVQRGLDIADGQTFRLSDGVRHVVFEYVDTSIANNQPEQGRIAVPFLPSDPDYVVAQRVRDAINGPDAQAVLDVTAAIGDGTILGAGDPTPSTSGRVNLFGPVTLRIHATDVEEVNDTIAQASGTQIIGLDSPSYLGSGYLGDNPNFPLNPGFDVDLFRVAVSAGETLRIDVDANEIGSPLDAALRLFDAAGNEVLDPRTGLPIWNDDGAAPGEYLRLDPYLEFTPLVSGIYFVGVSGVNLATRKYNLGVQDDNITYDSRREGSGVESGTLGFYQIEITFGASTGSDFVLYDQRGDGNQFRDQGQILIQGNTIANSSQYGILAAAAARSGQDNDIPHMGPVRQTPKLNAQNLVTGVVIDNNVLAGNQAGGIRFAGDPNTGNVQTASVPFGRIVNNTIYGGIQTSPTVTPVDVVFLIDTSASMAGDITELRNRIASLNTEFLARNIDPRYGLVTFPAGNPADAPRQIQNITDYATFVSATGAFQTFQTGGDSQEYGSQAVREMLNDAEPLTNFTFRTGSQIVGILLTDEDDDSSAADFNGALAALRATGSKFFGIALDPNAPFSGNTAQTYSELARQSSGQLMDINDFRLAPAQFFNAFTQMVVGSIAGGLGTGIRVDNNASPTLLNNIVASLATGLSVDGSSVSTVVGGMLYFNNQTNQVGVATQDFPVYLSSADPLFRDASLGNFYLAPLSPAIDSSVGSLLERFDLKQVKNILGISDSPILAPGTDVTGQLRVDDPQVETPSGFGEQVFVDRGAVDRSDFAGPTAQPINPRDNDADGVDRNPDATALALDQSSVLSAFRIRLVDGVPPADPNLGSGIDDTTVNTGNVTVTRNGVLLVDGVDYSFSYNATSDTVLITPISGIWQTDSLYQIRINNRDYFRIVAQPGSLLPDGYQFLVRDAEGTQATFEFESGYTLQVPQTLQILIPAAGGSLGGVVDGQTFRIQRVGGTIPLQTVVFEFDSNGVWVDNNNDQKPDNRLIPFNVASTAAQIAEAMVTQLIAADLGLSPRYIGDDEEGKAIVHLGSTGQHTVDAARARSLTVTGQPDGIRDGGFFTIDDGTRIVTFEFDSNGQRADADNDGVADRPTAILIPFNASQTNDEIAQTMVNVIALAEVGLQPVAIGNGGVHLGGIPYVHRVEVVGPDPLLPWSNLQSVGQPGVRQPAFGIQIPTSAGKPRIAADGSGAPFIQDGDTFTISDGTSSITFELDNLDDPLLGGRTTAPNVVVAYRASSTVDDIANVLVAAIQNAPLRDLRPSNAGRGIVLLGEPTDGSSRHVLDMTQTGLAQVGSPGVPAAISVVVSPRESFDGTQVAVRLLQALNGSALNVTAVPGSGAVVEIEGAVAVLEINPVFADNDRYLGVKDLAGNSLKPNLLSGETLTTILLGRAAMDFGDAPQTTAGAYPTKSGLNGPVHMIGGPLFLGSRVDSEQDGLVSADVRGDDLDGENMTVNTSGSAHISLRDDTGGTVQNDLLPTVMVLPVPLSLTVADGLVVRDETQFRVTNGAISVMFEFENLDENDGLTNPDFVAVPFRATSTPAELGESIARIVRAQTALKLAPAHLGDGFVHIGGDGLSTRGVGVTASGQADFVVDGETFTMTPFGAATPLVFEFEDRDLDNGVQPGRIPVYFSVATTQDGLAASIIASVLGTTLGIAGTNLGEGRVEFSGRDDDGVVMGAFNPQTVTQITIIASADGLLDAWIDFNRDGDFEDLGEQVFAGQQVQAGENVFEIQPPATSVYGTTVGRFRLSSSGGLLPTGIAADGEVEDYPVVIAAGTPPIANPDSFTFDEDTVGTGTSLLSNDFDPDSPAGSLTVFSYQAISALKATIVVDTSSNPFTKGTFSYDPRSSEVIQALDVGEFLIDTFTYRAYDGQFLSAAGTVTVRVEGRNDVPIAVDDRNVFADQSATITIDVLANDRDPESDPLAILNTSGGLGSIAVVNNTLRYSPGAAFKPLDQGQIGTDTFTYRITDGKGGSAEATVVVTIFGQNDPPTAVNDTAANGARTTEDAFVDIPVLANDVDPEGSVLTVAGIQLVNTRGTVTVNNPNTPNNTVRYNPNGKFESLGVGKTGQDVFLYVVRDAQGNTSVGTVTVTIDGVNDPPTARNDTGSVARNQTTTITVLANDTDTDGDSLQVNAVGLTNTRGIASINQDNTITYDPNGQFDHLPLGQSATDRFTYTIGDGFGGSSTATVTITVFGASEPPVARNDAATTTEDSSVVISVLFNDTDDFGPKIVQSVNTTGLKGSAIISPLNQPNNQVIYSPDGQFDRLAAGQSETETFTYVVTDGIGTATATVVVTITGVNDAPIANIDANGYTVLRGKQLVANDVNGSTPSPADDSVLVNDSDAEGDAITAVRVTGPAHGVLVLNSDGTFTYTHNGNAATVDTFSYQARDVYGALSTQVVTVVLSIIDAPPAEWQNPINRYDVNNDGFVSPIDSLLVINLINDPAFGVGYEFPSPKPVGSYFYDVNGDDFLSASDVLAVINEINRQNSSSGEGERAAAAPGVAAATLEILPVAAPAGQQAAEGESLLAAAEDARRSAPAPVPVAEATIRLDLFGIEDTLDDIVQDVQDSLFQRTALDEVLDEIFA